MKGYTGPITEGSKMSLECEASDGNPNQYRYSWNFVPKYYKENQTLRISKSYLRQPASYYNSGIYTCTAQNYAGSVETSQDIKIYCKILVKRISVYFRYS